MKKLIEQFLKFGVVGAIAFFIDYGVLMLLNVGFGVNSVVAAGISFTVSVVFNYLASMRYVFTHRDDLSRGKEFAIFIVLSVIGLAINELVMWVGLVTIGGAPVAVTATKVVATAVVMIWNFFSRKKWLDAGDGAGQAA
jgi:putative flippase GtrA